MRIVCDRHGTQPGLLISPDLREAIVARKSLPNCIELFHEYLGDKVERMVFSQTFAGSEGFAASGSIPLPEDYPPWFLRLVPGCTRCVEEIAGVATPGDW